MTPDDQGTDDQGTDGPAEGAAPTADVITLAERRADRRGPAPMPPPIPLFPSARADADDNLVQLTGSTGDEDGEPVQAFVQEDGTLSPPPEHLLPAAIEALLLAAEGPVSIDQLDRWLGGPGTAKIRAALHAWARRQNSEHGGIRLVQVAKGWQLRTDVRFAPWVAAMRGGRPLRLSRAALDTLAILAYRQPATRSEIEDLRGVESGGVLRMLCERGLAMVVGRKDVPGRPLLYGTTRGFLSLFNLRDLSDLPTLRDLRELYGDRLPDDSELGPDPLEGEDDEAPDAAEPAEETAAAADAEPATEDDAPDDPPPIGRTRKHLGLVRKPPPAG